MKKYKYEIDGDIFEIRVHTSDGDSALVEVNGQSYNVNIVRSDKPESRPVVQRPAAPPVERLNSVVASASGGAAPRRGGASGGSGAGMVPAPLPGVIVRILVKEGDEVQAGQPVMVLKAMKMENTVEAPRAGKVSSIAVREGDSVMEGDSLLTIGG